MEKSMKYYIAIGGNLGDPFATFNRLAAEISPVKASSLYLTEPVGGPPGQPRYLNGMLVLDSMLTPFRMLDQLQAVESRYGRVRSVVNAPRTLDLDICYISGLRVESGRLTVPHPRARERSFVMVPLADVDNDLAEMLTDGMVGSMRSEVEMYAHWDGMNWKAV
jgi:2-amino-4-hydroxy-6-hydroxymethyldihydropteridine diphosphokinase